MAQATDTDIQELKMAIDGIAKATDANTRAIDTIAKATDANTRAIEANAKAIEANAKTIDTLAKATEANTKAIADLAQEMRLGFANIEVKFEEVKGEIKTTNIKLDERTKAIEIKLEEKTKAIETKLEERTKAIEIKLEEKTKAIETKLDERGKAVEILQKRLDTTEATRSRLIAGLMGAVFATSVTLITQRIIPPEPPRNPANRGAMHYVPPAIARQ
jgi:chromosome segregation ATPase